MVAQEFYKLTPAEINSAELALQTEINAVNSLMPVVDLLIMWGGYHRYITCCGFQRSSAFFSTLNTKKSRIFIEKDIDIIDNILLELKTSSAKKQQQQYAVIEAYYKGVDLVVDGYDWSQKLTIREIAELLNQPKSTILNRKKQAEQFIFERFIELS